MKEEETQRLIIFVAALSFFQRDLKLDPFRRDGQGIAAVSSRPVHLLTASACRIVSISGYVLVVNSCASRVVELVCQIMKSSRAVFDFTMSNTTLTGIIKANDLAMPSN